MHADLPAVCCPARSECWLGHMLPVCLLFLYTNLLTAAPVPCVMLCPCVLQAVGDAPVLRALSRASHAGSAANVRPGEDPVQDLLAHFTDLQGTKGGRGGAEALYVLQVRADETCTMHVAGGSRVAAGDSRAASCRL